MEQVAQVKMTGRQLVRGLAPWHLAAYDKQAGPGHGASWALTTGHLY